MKKDTHTQIIRAVGLFGFLFAFTGILMGAFDPNSKDTVIFASFFLLISSLLARISVWPRIKSKRSKFVLLLIGSIGFLLAALSFDFFLLFNIILLFLAIVLIVDAIVIFRSKEIEKR